MGDGDHVRADVARWSMTGTRTWAVAALVVIASASCDGESMVRATTSQNHVLRVQGDGAGSGAVTAPDASPQLACSITKGAPAGVCAIAYPSSSTVRLIATPNVASAFSGWSGACAGTDECVVEMSNERVVTAAFVAK